MTERVRTLTPAQQATAVRLLAEAVDTINELGAVACGSYWTGDEKADQIEAFLRELNPEVTR